MYALITGASSGIGREMALILAQKGYDLILAARRKDRLEKMKALLEKRYSIHVVAVVCDLSRKADCLSLCNAFQDYPVEILINGAGFGKIGYITETSLETQLSMIDTNITALHILSRQFAKQAEHGYILNIASIAASQPDPFFAVYGATKAYVSSFSLALGYELKKQGSSVSVTTLCPGPVATEFDQVAGASVSLNAISAKKCAKEGLRGMFRKKRLVIPSFTTKAAYLASKLSPLAVILPVIHRIQRKKYRES